MKNLFIYLLETSSKSFLELCKSYLNFELITSRIRTSLIYFTKTPPNSSNRPAKIHCKKKV